MGKNKENNKVETKVESVASNIGRPCNIKSEEQLYQYFEEYKERRKKESINWPKVQYVGKDGTRKEDYPVLPLTLDGFFVFCRVKGYGCVKQYFTNVYGAYDRFLPICAHIKEEIRDFHITGGSLNVFNASITQRLHGLVEQTEVKADVNTNSSVDITSLPTEVLEQLLKHSK